MSDTKLLPCPFCGSKRPKFERHCNVNFWIACRCGASMDNKTDEAKAIAAWNTRALTPEQAAAGDMREALEAAEVMVKIMLCCWGNTSTNDNGKFRNITGSSTLAEIRAALAKAGRS